MREKETNRGNARSGGKLIHDGNEIMSIRTEAMQPYDSVSRCGAGFDFDSRKYLGRNRRHGLRKIRYGDVRDLNLTTFSFTPCPPFCREGPPVFTKNVNNSSLDLTRTQD